MRGTRKAGPRPRWRLVWASLRGTSRCSSRAVRQPSDALRRRLARVLQLPATSLPVSAGRVSTDADALATELADLGYPGFAHLRRRRPLRNPAAVLLDALASEALDSRTAEALPWLVLTFPDLDWDWLLSQAKQQDLQNRLGYVVSLARSVAACGVGRRSGPRGARGSAGAEPAGARGRVRERLPSLKRSADGFGRTGRLRPAHWNLLSDLRAEHLSYVG